MWVTVKGLFGCTRTNALVRTLASSHTAGEARGQGSWRLASTDMHSLVPAASISQCKDEHLPTTCS